MTNNFNSENALDEKRIMLKDALANQQINQETYDRLIAWLDKKEKEMKEVQADYNFRHSKPMRLALWILLFIIVAILFVLCIRIWVWAYWKAGI